MAGEVSILEIKGTEKLKAALDKLLKTADKNIPIVLMQAGQVGVSHCKIECPVDTGRLRASIGNPTKKGIFETTRKGVAFGTAVDYAFDVEFGTKPHIIKPKKKKVLRWPIPVGQEIKFTEKGIKRGKKLYISKKTGKLIKKKQYAFAKFVKHPGTKGQHFMLKGVQKAVPDIIKVLKGVIKG